MKSIAGCTSLTIAGCALAFLLPSCTDRAATTGDGASGVIVCTSDSDCSDDQTFVCFAGSCRLNTCTPDAGCSNGATCDPLRLICLTPSEEDADGGAPCTSKYDCDFGQSCVDDRCGTAAVLCSTDSQCARGEYCNILNEHCVPGCDRDDDCMPPETCNPVSFACTKPCGPTSPCPAGQLCANNGTCEESTSCVISASCDATSTGSICQANGLCGPCTTAADCSQAPYGAGYACIGGVCALGCATNQDCAGDGGLSGAPLCNTATGQCVQCIQTSDCSSAGAICINNTCTMTSTGSCLSVGNPETCESYCRILQGLCNRAGDCCTM